MNRQEKKTVLTFVIFIVLFFAGQVLFGVGGAIAGAIAGIFASLIIYLLNKKGKRSNEK